MGKTPPRDLSEFRAGAECMNKAWSDGLKELVTNMKCSAPATVVLCPKCRTTVQARTESAADVLIRFLNTKAPTVGALLAAELNASVPPGKINISAGLVPKDAL